MNDYWRFIAVVGLATGWAALVSGSENVSGRVINHDPIHMGME